MIACLCVILFFIVVVTGPAGIEWRERRRALADRPAARIEYLPAGCCRVGSLVPGCPCASCGARKDRTPRHL